MPTRARGSGAIAVPKDPYGTGSAVPRDPMAELAQQYAQPQTPSATIAMPGNPAITRSGTPPPPTGSTLPRVGVPTAPTAPVPLQPPSVPSAPLPRPIPAPGPDNFSTSPVGGGRSGDYAGFGQAWIASGGRTPADLAAFIQAHPEYGATITGSKGDKVTIGGRTFDAVIAAGLGGQGASWSDITNGGGGAVPVNTQTQYPDQSTELLLNTVLQRLQELQKPVQDPFGDLYAQKALELVAKLGAAPFSDAESQALITQYRDPLTQARDARKQQITEELGARGFGPTSGVFRSELAQVDDLYQQGIAQGSNALGVRAVQQKQANQAQQMQLLDSLVSMGRMSRQEATQRAQELLQNSAIPMDIDLQRLNALLAASGDNQVNPSSIFSNIAQQQALANQQNQIANQQSQANAATWGQLIGYLLSGLS